VLRLALAAALAAGAVCTAAAAGSGDGRAASTPLPGLIPHTSPHATARPSARRTSQTTAFSCGVAACTGYESAIDQFLTDVAHDSGSSNVFSVATQYSDSTGRIAYDSTFGGAYVDTTPYPASQCNDATRDGQDSVCLTDAQLQTEIAHAIAVNGWTEDSTRPAHLYAIFTPTNVGICDTVGSASGNRCSTNVFCAYHDDFSPAPNVVAAYAVLPDDATVPGGGCANGSSPNGTGADMTINALGHEMNEAITDPWPEATPAWFSSAGTGGEIGDLCVSDFGTVLGSTATGSYNQVINGHDYWLQEEYSNAGGGCVPYLGGPVSAPRGSGPVVYHGGPVMRTNTVYAIYWVPTTTAQVPDSTEPPVVTGTAGVGKKLTTTNGTWAGSPTSYAYEWLRCSGNGTHCAAIPGAGSATYTVAQADAGHDLMAQVTATNAAASVSATSLPTYPVVAVPHLVRKPRIAGVAKVGKRLRATSARWSGPPTAFHYRWLRCSAKGTSCRAIHGANGSSHVLATADARHRLRVQVTAVNAAGHARATSAASRVVT